MRIIKLVLKYLAIIVPFGAFFAFALAAVVIPHVGFGWVSLTCLAIMGIAMCMWGDDIDND